MSVFQATMPEAFSPPRHIHTREDEVFLVLDGEVCFDLDGRKRLAGPGTTSTCRAGCRTRSGSRARSPDARDHDPGACEQLFRNLSAPAGERALPARGTVPLDVPAVMAEQIRLGTEVVGPPMRPEDV